MSLQALDALTFPLQGSRLIEASAGTGKTWTIAMLYVRLVLGASHEGDANAFDRPLMPPDLLVVTFTDAATQELRSRIRQRLAQAAEVFRAEATAAPSGDLSALFALREQYPASDWPRLATWLQVAAEWMDQAAISTIHGWCMRMLREHAFGGQALFRQTLSTDPTELLAEAARDCWRTFYRDLSLRELNEVLAWWKAPSDLLNAVRRLLPYAGHPEFQAVAHAQPANLLAMHHQQRAETLQALKAHWPDWIDELRVQWEADDAQNRIDRRKFRAQFYQPWLDALKAWATSDDQTAPDLKTGWTRLTPQGMSEAYKDPTQAPQHLGLQALADLQQQIAGLPDAQSDLLRHATVWVRQRFDQAQAQRAQLGFDDLLRQLDAALQAPSGPALAQAIRQQFPVALIDEFQDTDPLQYRIFDAVYRVEQPWPGTALVLIGDPKQAIYAFRGADIHTYLQARRDCAGRLYSLDTNHRSSQAMVDAVNHCFEQAERRTSGTGAFTYRSADGDNPVPFHRVKAAGRATLWCPHGMAPHPAAAPALTVWHLPPSSDGGAVKPDDALDPMAQACAATIAGWLKGRQAGFATPRPDGGTDWQALRPQDVAVLVNHRGEARAIRSALARHGVPSVYLSDRESVYQSDSAEDLHRWLQACHQPQDARALRAALATRNLALDWHALDRLRHDELAWDDMVERFRQFQQVWRQRGVLPMVQTLLHTFDVPARLLAPAAGDALPDGERRLTDILHLAELLQHASQTLDGEHALIRYLAEQCELAQTGEGGDAPILRLESDAQRVRVITVHKSKGLEYPLVFYPWATYLRTVKAKDTLLRWHGDDGNLQLATGGTSPAKEEAAQRADRERLAEDLRKLYVGLTRARYATWLGVAPVAQWEDSAIGHLINGGQALDATPWPQVLHAALGGPAHTVIEPAPIGDVYHAGATSAVPVAGTPAASAMASGALPPAEAVARTYRGQPRPRWWIASYSALRLAAPDADAPVHLAVPDTAQDDLLLEPDDHQLDAASWSNAEDNLAPPSETQLDLWATAEPAPASTTPGAHAFPKGSAAGTLLHDALQWCAEQGWTHALHNPQRLRDKVAQLCQSHGWDDWADTATDWLTELLQAPLPLPATTAPEPASGNTGSHTDVSATNNADGPCLAQLATCQAEMEFWLAVALASTQDLDRLVTQHTLGGAPRPPLQADQLHGMLKGFIDLVFEHEGRYYVADYKSNWLGPDDSHYTAARLQQAVLDARYDLQYSLYLLALHRLLRQRLPGYDYEQHMGGAVYLFLRGWRGPARGVLHERPPRAFIEALDRLFDEGSPAC